MSGASGWLRPSRVAWVGLAVVAAALGIGGRLRGPRAGSDGDVPWEAPDFSFVDQDGQRVTRASLRGHAWVADFLYTRCTSACPTLSARMVLLQRRVPRPDVRFVSFSVDPAHDTPAVLKEYAARWRGDREPRWHLLATDEAGLAATALGLRALVEATRDPDEPFLHSDRFVLVDREGQVRGRYASSDQAELAKLALDLEAAAGPALAAAAVAPDSLDGPTLYLQAGCEGCHGRPQVAPPLAGLLGREVLLGDAGAVKADREYLRESIVDPARRRVPGYPVPMPSYADALSRLQVEALVEHLAGLRGAEPPATPRATAVDPVCGMSVSVGPDTPHATIEGQDHWFCSDGCRDRFVAAPGRYRR